MKKLGKNSKILVTGHKGLVGSAIVRRLKFFGYKKILTISKKKLNLENQEKVNNYFKKNKPDAVINAAAKVGGIYANQTQPATFIFSNLSIQLNIINACYKNNIPRLIFLGSSCIYPKFCKQPIKESYLLNGYLEKSNEAYAVSKISGIKLCESFNKQYKTNYKCLMPCNVYGPNDNYDNMTSHFFPALIKKILLAKKKQKKFIKIWGSGKPKRELIYVDDVADACIFFLNKNIKHDLLNVGSGKDYSITQYAKFIMKTLKTNKKIIYDKGMLDGTPRKLLDSSLANKAGWKPKVKLLDGLEKTISNINIKKLI
tara:strand:+ start:13120 stop:14061 length:942 start_codon:yes stop_codon:yes gene_type:complete